MTTFFLPNGKTLEDTSTAQEVFNTVVDHLRTQGKPSVTENHQCRYRHPNGTMCGVGALIPDDVYKECMEGEGILDLSYGTYHLPRYITSNLGLLDELQTVHDSCQKFTDDDVFHKHPLFGDDLEDRLAKVARSYGLTYFPVSKMGVDLAGQAPSVQIETGEGR